MPVQIEAALAKQSGIDAPVAEQDERAGAEALPLLVSAGHCFATLVPTRCE